MHVEVHVCVGWCGQCCAGAGGAVRVWAQLHGFVRPRLHACDHTLCPSCAEARKCSPPHQEAGRDPEQRGVQAQGCKVPSLRGRPTTDAEAQHDLLDALGVDTPRAHRTDDQAWEMGDALHGVVQQHDSADFKVWAGQGLGGRVWAGQGVWGFGVLPCLKLGPPQGATTFFHP